METTQDKFLLESAEELTSLPVKTYVQRGVTVNEVTVTPQLARKTNRRQGHYVTILPDHRSKPSTISKVIETSLSRLVKKLGVDGGKALVVGLGNRNYTADALGYEVAKAISKVSTRYQICSLIPQLAGLTGISSYDIIRGVIYTQKPSLVIIIDSLSTNKIDRLGKSFQLTTAGISAGSGVDNAQPILDKSSLGAPVIAIGCPLVISVGSIYDKCALPSAIAQYVVTPSDIDKLVKESGSIITAALNNCLR
ncbi:MAG: GPR endopeptidase [Clostridia bacterium]